METDFFKQLFSHPVDADWKIITGRNGEGVYTVSIIPVNPKVTDNAVNAMIPLIMRGTPETLDKIFFEHVGGAGVQAAQKMTNIQDFIVQMKKVEELSKMNEEKKRKQKELQEQQQKKFDQKMKKVDDLESENKFGEAIAALPDPKHFPDQKTEIETRAADLRKKSPSLSLFES